MEFNSGFKGLRMNGGVPPLCLNALTVWSGQLCLFINSFLSSFLCLLFLFPLSCPSPISSSFLPSNYIISPNCENVTLINTAVLFDRTVPTLSISLTQDRGVPSFWQELECFCVSTPAEGWLLYPLTLSNQAWLKGLTRTIS